MEWETAAVIQVMLGHLIYLPNVAVGQFHGFCSVTTDELFVPAVLSAICLPFAFCSLGLRLITHQIMETMSFTWAFYY